MSVPKDQRGKSKCKACTSACDLCKYTIQIIHNPNTFDPKYSRVIDRIEDVVLDIHISCGNANDIVVKTEKDMNERISLQKYAYEKCKELLRLIDLAYPLFKLRWKRIDYWVGETIKTRDLISAWCKSDYKRYSARLKQ